MKDWVWRIGGITLPGFEITDYMKQQNQQNLLTSEVSFQYIETRFQSAVIEEDPHGRSGQGIKSFS
jgi:hypothetical protein